MTQASMFVNLPGRDQKKWKEVRIQEPGVRKINAGVMDSMLQVAGCRERFKSTAEAQRAQRKIIEIIK